MKLVVNDEHRKAIREIISKVGTGPKPAQIIGNLVRVLETLEVEHEGLPRNPYPPTFTTRPYKQPVQEVPNPDWVAYNRCQQDMLQAGFKQCDCSALKLAEEERMPTIMDELMARMDKLEGKDGEQPNTTDTQVLS